MEEEAEGNVRPISYSQAYPRLSLLLPIFLKIEAGFILVRFLSLVTTMVTKVDHGNHRSNNRDQLVSPKMRACHIQTKTT